MEQSSENKNEKHTFFCVQEQQMLIYELNLPSIEISSS